MNAEYLRSLAVHGPVAASLVGRSRKPGVQGRTVHVKVDADASPSLVVAFALTVMADTVPSVAYAIESALRGLNGDLDSLFPTMVRRRPVIATSMSCAEASQQVSPCGCPAVPRRTSGGPASSDGTG
jgi:hypothetical protein